MPVSEHETAQSRDCFSSYLRRQANDLPLLLLQQRARQGRRVLQSWMLSPSLMAMFFAYNQKSVPPSCWALCFNLLTITITPMTCGHWFSIGSDWQGENIPDLLWLRTASWSNHGLCQTASPILAPIHDLKAKFLCKCFHQSLAVEAFTSWLKLERLSFMGYKASSARTSASWVAPKKSCKKQKKYNTITMVFIIGFKSRANIRGNWALDTFSNTAMMLLRGMMRGCRVSWAVAMQSSTAMVWQNSSWVTLTWAKVIPA